VRYYFLQKLLRNLLYNNVDILVKQRRFLWWLILLYY
jgi:hypothetical protein